MSANPLLGLAVRFVIVLSGSLRIFLASMTASSQVHKVKRLTQGATGANTINIYNTLELASDMELDEILPWATDIDSESGAILPWEGAVDVPESAYIPHGFHALAQAPPEHETPFEARVHIPEPIVLPVWQSKVHAPEHASFETGMEVPEMDIPVWESKIHVPEHVFVKTGVAVPTPKNLPVWESKIHADEHLSLRTGVAVPTPKNLPVWESKVHADEHLSLKTGVDMPEPRILPAWKSRVHVVPLDPAIEDIHAAAMAEAMREAARTGAPFCERCTRARLEAAG